VLDVLFPRLSGGLVASLNRRANSFQGLRAIPSDLVGSATLHHSLLFETAVVRAEAILADNEERDWGDCLQIALERQRRHFDAKTPPQMAKSDEDVADWTATNLVAQIRRIEEIYGYGIQARPTVAGFGWIATGVGDFACNPLLIEVKNTDRNFISADYRQVLIYWLLKYSATLQFGEDMWTEFALINPRRNYAVFGRFDELIIAASGGHSRVEVYEYFRSIVVGDFENRQ
jgi:hypothetical protein